MPHIDHAAIWVADLDDARDFYSHWFNGHANGLYENPRTGLRTHILQFTDGPWEERRTRLELMSRPDITALAERTGLGWAHVSFCLPGREDVDRLAADMAEAGVRIIDGPARLVTDTTRPPSSIRRATASSSSPRTTPTTSPSARPTDDLADRPR